MISTVTRVHCRPNWRALDCLDKGNHAPRLRDNKIRRGNIMTAYTWCEGEWNDGNQPLLSAMSIGVWLASNVRFDMPWCQSEADVR